MSHLYPQLPFISDETPLSWAARLAALHTGGPLVPFLNDQSIGLDDLVAGRAYAIYRLCERAVQDPAPVLHNTVQRLGDRRYRLRGETFSAELLTGRRVRFCPACLAEDSAKSIPGPMSRQNVTRRGRLIWVFSPVRTCETHQLPLMERQRDNWDRVTKELAAFVPETDDELRALSDFQPKQSTSPLQDYVVRRLDGDLGPEWLDRQSLDQATRASEMIGALLQFGPGKQAAALDEQDWDIAGRAAWPVVSEGQTGVKAALMSCHAAAEAIGHQAFARPGPYGMLQSWLASSKLSKNPGPIRDILRDHIIETQDVAIGAKLFDEVVQHPRWVNIAALAKSERVHPLTLRNILIARKSCRWRRLIAPAPRSWSTIRLVVMLLQL